VTAVRGHGAGTITTADGPALSVLVCTRNRGDKVGHALESILSNTFNDIELIVIDQSADDRTRDVVSHIADDRVRYIRTATVGLAKSRNIAIKASRSETIVFTDDDCICEPDWLATIVAEFEADNSIAGIFGRVLPYGESRGEMICACLMDSLERCTVDRPVVPYLVLGHGNNMSFKKSLFRKVGLFIESLGAGTAMKAGEDTELIYRALRLHMKFIYSPRTLVYHDNWLTPERFAVLLDEYVLAASAVFAKFAAKLDIFAATYVIRTGYTFLRQRSRRKLLNHLLGVAVGVRYAFTRTPSLNVRPGEVSA
jgi:glycosyltransferase involved in cell wall biosynthesis